MIDAAAKLKGRGVEDSCREQNDKMILGIARERTTC